MNIETTSITHDGKVHTSGYLREVGPGPFKELNDSYVPPLKQRAGQSFVFKIDDFNFAAYDLAFLEERIWKQWLQQRQHTDTVRTALSDLSMSPHLMLSYEVEVGIYPTPNSHWLQEQFNILTDAPPANPPRINDRALSVTMTSGVNHDQPISPPVFPPDGLDRQRALDAVTAFGEKYRDVKLGSAGQSDLISLVHKVRTLLVTLRPDEVCHQEDLDGRGLRIYLQFGYQSPGDQLVSKVGQARVAIHLRAP